jgi:hypothetical protein
MQPWEMRTVGPMVSPYRFVIEDAGHLECRLPDRSFIQGDLVRGLHSEEVAP